jgi:hypothetical protein
VGAFGSWCKRTYGVGQSPRAGCLAEVELRLEDMVREEGMEIEVGKSKGWIWGFVNFWLGN